MNFWKTKRWSPADIACLKWSCLLIGAAFGTLMAEMLKPYVIPLLVVALVLAIKPTLNYYRKEKAV